MAIPKIFISYSHKDEDWKERLLLHLRVLERQNRIEIWDTSNLQAGSDWSRDIAKAIKDADIAVLLLSSDFLASDYIIQREFPLMLQRNAKNGLIVLPMSVRPSIWTTVPELAQFQFLNDPNKPLVSLSDSERDIVLAAAAQRIIKLTEAINEQDLRQQKRNIQALSDVSSPVDSSSSIEKVESQLFVSHSKTDGDFAELLKLKLEREGYSAWIDVDRLGPGVDWRQEIDDSIKKSIALIAIMSPEARESEYVTYEWAFCWGAGVKIIPIMLRQTTMHPRLATLQFLDFTNRIARPWSKLFDALNTARNGNDNPE